jgi:hypothetical protein
MYGWGTSNGGYNGYDALNDFGTGAAWGLAGPALGRGIRAIKPIIPPQIARWSQKNLEKAWGPLRRSVAKCPSSKGKPPAVAEHVPPRKSPWNTWLSYPKVMRGGEEYANVGGRLYSRHAIDRLQPSGLRYRPRPKDGSKTGGVPQIRQAGSYDYGRSVSPSYVEHVLRTTVGIRQKNGNISHLSGDLEVITNDWGGVVTVMTH